MNEEPEPCSFDTAKIWSDYLGFHIRALVFFTLGFGCANVAAETWNLEIDVMWAKYFQLTYTVVACVAFSVFAIVMLVRISNLNINYLLNSYDGRTTSPMRKLAFSIMMIVECWIMASVALALLSIASTQGFL